MTNTGMHTFLQYPDFRAREMAHCTKALDAEFNPWNPCSRRRKTDCSKLFSDLKMFHVHLNTQVNGNGAGFSYFGCIFKYDLWIMWVFENRFFVQDILISFPSLNSFQIFPTSPPTQVHTLSLSLSLEYKQTSRK